MSMDDKVYIIEGGSGSYDDAYPFNYGIFTDKQEADKYCLRLNNLIAEAKEPFAHINCITDDKWDTLSIEQKSRYFEVIDLWEAYVKEVELNKLLDIGILKTNQNERTN